MYVNEIIIIIKKKKKRISTAPIYRTRWEHRRSKYRKG